MMYRVKNNESILGGVCQGLAIQQNFDVTLVRLFAVLLIFTPIPAIIIYLVLWVSIPKVYDVSLINSQNDKNSNNFKPTYNMNNQSRNGNMVGGLVLIILGAIFSFKTFFDINLFSYIKNVWPLALVGLGIWIILKEKDDNNIGNSGNDESITGTNY